MSRPWWARAAILVLLIGVSVLLLLPALRHDDTDVCVSCGSPVSRFVDRCLHVKSRPSASMPKRDGGAGEMQVARDGSPEQLLGRSF